jgi:hypothetical protein
MGGETPGGASFVPSLASVLQIALAFALTCLAWVFFRAATVTDAALILRRIAVDVTTTRPAFLYKQAAVWIVILFAIEWVQRHHANPLHLERFPRPLRWCAYYAFAASIFMFAPLRYTPFIYFQF